MCDPAKESLCLYGYHDGSWELKRPVEDVPSDFPEPNLGINHMRDTIKDWQSFVAAHCDAWLFALAFFFCARIGFGNSGSRERLFEMMNELPTISEVVEVHKLKGLYWNQKGKRCDLKKKMPEQSKLENMPAESKEDEKVEVTEEDDEDYVCGVCGEYYVANGLWIKCDFCPMWFHCKCVNITAAAAKRVKQYKCSFCKKCKNTTRSVGVSSS